MFLRVFTPEGERSVSLDKRARTIDVVASTEAPDGHGTRILSSAWDLRRYETNPIVLTAHQTKDLHSILGTAKAKVVGKRLVAKINFLSAGLNPEADYTYELFRSGVLRGISVGFIPHEYRDEPAKRGKMVRTFTKVELVELSAVPVPSNAEALAMAREMILFSTPEASKPKGQQAATAQKPRTATGPQVVKAVSRDPITQRAEQLIATGTDYYAAWAIAWREYAESMQAKRRK